MSTPAILFLVFNRPDVTTKVLEAIRIARPQQLFVAADGPRPGRSADATACAEVRRIIREGIDWDCKLTTLFREENLGCGRAVSQAITWFFTQVEAGIILEDDTLPDPTFFPYCEELLQRYKEDERILMVNGDNFQFGRSRSTASYYASRYAHIWGWATWRRAWSHYSFELKYTEDEWKQLCAFWQFSDSEERIWRRIFGQIRSGEVDTWDYQWQYTLFEQKAACISPNVNLVTNLGFGANAAHTVDGTSLLSQLPAGSLDNIIHPDDISINKEADAFSFRHYFGTALRDLAYENEKLIALTKEMTLSSEGQDRMLKEMSAEINRLLGEVAQRDAALQVRTAEVAALTQQVSGLKADTERRKNKRWFSRLFKR